MAGGTLYLPAAEGFQSKAATATQLQTLGCNGHRVQSPGPRGMGWPSGFAGPADALRAKEAGDGF